MTEQNQKQLGKTLWAIADKLRGAMDADDFRDYMLSFLFLRYLSDNYETAAKKELGADYPAKIDSSVSTPLQFWYESNLDDVPESKPNRFKARSVDFFRKSTWARRSWAGLTSSAMPSCAPSFRRLPKGWQSSRPTWTHSAMPTNT